MPRDNITQAIMVPIMPRDIMITIFLIKYLLLRVYPAANTSGGNT
jgi:hypothetical protein